MFHVCWGTGHVHVSKLVSNLPARMACSHVTAYTLPAAPGQQDGRWYSRIHPAHELVCLAQLHAHRNSLQTRNARLCLNRQLLKLAWSELAHQASSHLAGQVRPYSLVYTPACSGQPQEGQPQEKAVFVDASAFVNDFFHDFFCGRNIMPRVS